MGAARPASRTPGTVPGLPHPNPHGRHTEAHMEPKHGGGILSAGREEAASGAMEADPFEQPYWNLDQYLIWLASRDPAAVLRATDHPNSGANPPIGWRVHQESNFDRQKVEMEAVRAIQSWPARQVGIGKSGAIKAHVRLNRKWVIDFEDEPPFAALLMATTKHGRQKKVRPQFNPQSIVQLYRAPTLSNVCYRLDDPGVGRFIA